MGRKKSIYKAEICLTPAATCQAHGGSVPNSSIIHSSPLHMLGSHSTFWTPDTSSHLCSFTPHRAVLLPRQREGGKEGRREAASPRSRSRSLRSIFHAPPFASSSPSLSPSQSPLWELEKKGNSATRRGDVWMLQVGEHEPRKIPF